MSQREVRVVTPEVVQLVEHYVYSELSDAGKYENRSPLDESGIWSLHALAARIYAAGFDAGERVESERGRAERQRANEAARAAAAVVVTGAQENQK